MMNDVDCKQQVYETYEYRRLMQEKRLVVRSLQLPSHDASSQIAQPRVSACGALVVHQSVSWTSTGSIHPVTARCPPPSIQASSAASL